MNLGAQNQQKTGPYCRHLISKIDAFYLYNQQARMKIKRQKNLTQNWYQKQASDVLVSSPVTGLVPEAILHKDVYKSLRITASVKSAPSIDTLQTTEEKKIICQA